MEKVLLISNKVLHYRIKIYNYLNSRFKKKGYELIILSNEIQLNAGIDPEFETHIAPFNIFKFVKRIKRIKPDYVILFLHLKNFIMIPVILYLKIKKIPVIYWNHGVNQLDPHNAFKNLIYYFIHKLVDRILLYTPNERKFIQSKNQEKVFIANNTIVFDENLYPINDNKEYLKTKLDIKSRFNVLFVGRDRIYKNLNLIIEIIQSINNDNIGLLIVGPLMDKQKTLQKIENFKQIKYFGEIYDKVELSEIYWVSDIFCIPGTNGLGLNEAMFWGLPCITLNVRHSPEIWYLKHNENGYILNDDNELKETIINLSMDEKLLKRMSNRSREIILSEGHINNMYSGFEAVLESLNE